MKTQRRGFTLIELLAVIVIISILVALISVAAVSAIGTTKQAVVAADVSNLAMAIEDVRVRFNDYPPADFRNPNVPTSPIAKFVARQWPRYSGNLGNDLTTRGMDTSKFEPDKALVFWLSGFSPDVSDPFNGGGDKQGRYEFNEDRLVNGRYLSTASGPDTDKPFLYFDHRSYGVTNDYNVSPDVAKKPNSFQIISSGLDAKFSTTDDNITSYSGGKTMGELSDP